MRAEDVGRTTWGILATSQGHRGTRARESGNDEKRTRKLTVNCRRCLLDFFLDLDDLLGGGLATAPAAAPTAASTAGYRRDDHLRDALGGKEIREDDGEVGRDLGIARGLEEGVDLIGRDVGLAVFYWFVMELSFFNFQIVRRRNGTSRRR